MLGSVAVLLSIILLVANLPLIAFTLLLFILAYYLIKKFKNRSKKHKVKKYNIHKTIIFKKIKVRDLQKAIFDISMRLAVLGYVALSSVGLGGFSVSGAVAFREVQDEELLKRLLQSIPVDYSLIYVKSKAHGDLYLLCPRTSSSIKGKDEAVSIITGILNSLATAIPANEVRILEGKELVNALLTASFRGVEL
ncbi:MAG: hypothetical protein DRJ18_02490 [Candidatus Methanomethylicota archaeon]|nr:hypothetical protein [Candidatus Culexmicrobium cathedralense]RLE48071.1 MAG: hypothetical protein DRJ18_02490 [Candidatus Verstraetearchaeota archaeon]